MLRNGLLIALLSAGSASMMWSESVPVHAKLVPLGSASNEVQTRSAELSAEMKPEVKRSSFVMTNLSDKRIVAYVVAWAIDNPGGHKLVYQAYDAMRIRVPSAKGSHGFGLDPGENRIVSPAFNFHEREAAEIEVVGRLRQTQQNANAIRELSRITGIVPELDVVVYADNTFEGEDTSALSKVFSVEQNGKHDAALAVLTAVQKGESEGEIKANLQHAIEKAKKYPDVSSSVEAAYWHARSRWAQYLLVVWQKGGQQAALHISKEFASLPKVCLTRAGTVEP